MAFTAGSLGDGQVAGTITALYTVPALTVAYLKSLSFFNTDAAEQTVVVYIHRSGSTARAYRQYVLAEGESADVISPGTSIQFSAGDVISAISTDAATVDWALTGVLEA